MKLQTRLLLTSALVAMGTLLAADLVTYSKLKSFLYAQEDRRLDVSHRPIELGLQAGLPVTPRALGIEAPGIFVEVRGVTGELVGHAIARGPGFVPASPRLPSVINAMTPGFGGELRRYFTVASTVTSGPKWRVRTSLLDSGGFLVLAVPLDRVERTLGSLRRTELAVTLLGLLAAAGLAWWAVRRAVRPLAAMASTATRISSGQLDHRVPGAGANTEVGHVATALNDMLDRIQESFAERDASEARLRRFVADASHELRTPISAISAYAELFGRGADKRPDDLAKVMRGIASESGRMKRLVDDLLLLARLDEQPVSAERVPVDVVHLCRAAVESSNLIGPDWPVELRADRGVEVLAEYGPLRQVIDNLLTNVRVHTPKGTRATVTVSIDAGLGVITVTDAGSGLSPDEATHAFERFFRADPSRSRASGGAGLGLAIAARLVRSYDGLIDVRSDPNGATFEVRIPLVSSLATRPTMPAAEVTMLGGDLETSEILTKP